MADYFVEVGGPGGGAPTGAAGGDLGGTYPNPTVTDLTVASEAQGDILYRNAAGWVRLAAGTTGMALITAGAAANPAWGTDFGARNLVTTGVASVGATPASAGNVRLGKAASIKGNNNAGDADLNFFSAATTDVITYGGTANAGLVYATSTGNVHTFQVNSATVATIGASFISIGSTVAAAGAVRTANAVTALASRNAANSADLALVSTTSGNIALFGDSTNNGTTQLRASTTAQLVIGSIARMTVNSASWLFDVAQASPTITQTTRSTDAATNNMTVQAQSANALATGTNRDGGAVILTGGARTNTNGKRGSVRLQMNGTTEVMVEAADVQAEATKASRVFAVLRGAAITTTEMPSDTGDLVEYVGECAVAPTASPVSGAIRYVSGGDFFKRTTAGHQQSLGPKGATRTWPSDANYTAVLADYSATTLELTGGSLSATRNLVVPIVLGYQWTIVNNTTGSQSIQVIGASGTGVTIATGKTAIVRADGTNIVRVTADV